MAIRGIQSKLFRNLKPGDKFVVETGYGITLYQYAVVTVTEVREIQRNYFTGKRQWQICGTGYPRWFSSSVIAYSDGRVDLVQ